MTLHSPQIYHNSHWEFSLFDDCFKYGISMMDLDAVVERKEHFLILETKQPTLKYLPNGQFRTFKAFHNQGNFTILFGFGETNKPERYMLWNEGEKEMVNGSCDLDQFRNIVSEWFKRIDTLPPPHHL